jgi:DNA-binding transcriptional MerR regulator
MASAKEPAADLTIAELADVLGQALGADYNGVRNGRVRHLPDARTIRWYQTLGVVDRPTVFRGRTALYARRHVLQLAAIKKLQAAGIPLSDIQRGLAGRTDAELARAAGIRLADVDGLVALTIQARADAAATRLHHALEAAPARSRPAGAFWRVRPQTAAAELPPVHEPAAPPPPLQSISLGGTAALVWNGLPLASEELATVARLSRPLTEFLSSRAVSSAESAASRHLSPARPRKGDRT